MKKIFTLITMAILAMSANAQSWDFTKTQVTAEQIAADATNWEVTNDTRYTYLTATNKEALKLGTDELPDTKGLLFTGGEKKFRLDVNQRLGLNGKNLSLTIPGLKAGQTVTVKAKSANNSEARGFTVENITPVSGFFNSTSTDEQENVGTVTADGDVTITTTAGMNVFSITVEGGGNNDDPTPGGETGETEKYVAVTADGQLAPEFAAVIGEGNVATNVVDHNSIVKVETKSITLEAVASAVPKDVTSDAISTWNDVKWELKKQDDIAFNYVVGTGVCYTSWAYEEIVRDGSPTGEYRLLIGTDDNGWPNFYVTDGSHGLPISGLYYKFTPKTNGKLKMGVWMNKGNRRLFVVPSDTKQAIDYEVEGYINGQNETYTKEDGTEGSRKKYLTNDEIRALGTDPYVMGAGNNTSWVYVIVDLEAGKDYYVFSQNAQVGFQGFEFTVGANTGIVEMEAEPVKAVDLNAPAYNLAGQRVSRNTKGIVIINGKKYINR